MARRKRRTEEDRPSSGPSANTRLAGSGIIPATFVADVNYTLREEITIGGMLYSSSPWQGRGTGRDAYLIFKTNDPTIPTNNNYKFLGVPNVGNLDATWQNPSNLPSAITELKAWYGDLYPRLNEKLIAAGRATEESDIAADVEIDVMEIWMTTVEKIWGLVSILNSPTLNFQDDAIKRNWRTNGKRNRLNNAWADLTGIFHVPSRLYDVIDYYCTPVTSNLENPFMFYGGQIVLADDNWSDDSESKAFLDTLEGNIRSLRNSNDKIKFWDALNMHLPPNSVSMPTKVIDPVRAALWGYAGFSWEASGGGTIYGAPAIDEFTGVLEVAVPKAGAPDWFMSLWGPTMGYEASSHADGLGTLGTMPFAVGGGQTNDGCSVLIRLPNHTTTTPVTAEFSSVPSAAVIDTDPFLAFPRARQAAAAGSHQYTNFTSPGDLLLVDVHYNTLVDNFVNDHRNMWSL